MSAEGRGFIQNLLNAAGMANTNSLARVVRYADGFADVEVFPDMDLVQNVPYAFMQSGSYVVYIPLDPGDIVVLSYQQHEIDGPINGQAVISDRKRDIDDAVIIGTVNTAKPPTGGLVIASRDGGTKISIEGKDINITGMNINIKATENVTIEGKDNKGVF